MSVLQKIESTYAGFSATEKKIGDYIMQHPAEAVECPIAELASRCRVSEASVIRMCKHLGFSGYYQLRLALAAEAGAADRDPGGASNNSGPDSDRVDALFQSYSKEMLFLSGNLDRKAFYDVVRLLERADWIHILATGNSGSLSQYLGYRLGRMGLRCTFNPSSDFFMNQLNVAKKDDVAFAISRSGESKIVIDGIRLARERGLRIVTLTEYIHSQAAILSDYVLLSNGSPNKFSHFLSHSQLYEVAVLDALCSIIKEDLESGSRGHSEYPEMILADSKM